MQNQRQLPPSFAQTAQDIHTSWNGIGRRFHRLDLRTKVLIAPGEFDSFKDIYSANVVYYSRHVLGQHGHLKTCILEDLEHIDRFKVQLSTLVSEFFDAVDFFAHAVKQLSEGMNPLRDAIYLLRVSQFKEYSNELNRFCADSPKTHGFLVAIYQKYFYYLDMLVQVLQQSTSSYLVVPNANNWPKFDSEKNLYTLSTDANLKVPLIRMVCHMTALLDLHANILKDICLDCATKINPNNWQPTVINLSEGGVAIDLQKKFKVHERVEVFCWLPSVKSTINLQGSIVRIDSITGRFVDRIAIDFKHPTDFLQRAIRKEIQYQELKRLARAWNQLPD
ncbi:PilZ domain-containing protein [Thiomicrospira microaerophila]|uniref:PilZ domain-containing protein n=1 Tax=Thiomicrospira microaerophila TaxID=406020 RepID=UPI0005C8BCEB|nr:PilZ domain-containing protein [Thiomicrospira microaerophila]